MKHRLSFVLPLLFLASMACQGTVCRLADVDVDPALYEEVEQVEGKASGAQILGGISMGMEDRVKRAVMDALSKCEGAVDLINVTIKEDALCTMFYNRYDVTVTGMAVKSKEPGDSK